MNGIESISEEKEERYALVNPGTEKAMAQDMLSESEDDRERKRKEKEAEALQGEVHENVYKNANDII